MQKPFIFFLIRGKGQFGLIFHQIILNIFEMTVLSNWDWNLLKFFSDIHNRLRNIAK